MSDRIEADLPFPEIEVFSERISPPEFEEVDRVSNAFRGLVHGLMESFVDHPDYYKGEVIDQILFVANRQGTDWLVDVTRDIREKPRAVEADIAFGGIQAIRITRHQPTGLAPVKHSYELGSDDVVRRYDDTTGQSRHEISMAEQAELSKAGVQPGDDEWKDYISRKVSEGMVRDQSRLAEREAGANDQPIGIDEMDGLTRFINGD